jgi:hypothetical protein
MEDCRVGGADEIACPESRPVVLGRVKRVVERLYTRQGSCGIITIFGAAPLDGMDGLMTHANSESRARRYRRIGDLHYGGRSKHQAPH